MEITEAQKEKIQELAERFKVEVDPETFTQGLGLPDGWVCGWIGDRIYVGISPEGVAHS